MGGRDLTCLGHCGIPGIQRTTRFVRLLRSKGMISDAPHPRPEAQIAPRCGLRVRAFSWDKSPESASGSQRDPRYPTGLTHAGRRPRWAPLTLWSDSAPWGNRGTVFGNVAGSVSLRASRLPEVVQGPSESAWGWHPHGSDFTDWAST